MVQHQADSQERGLIFAGDYLHTARVASALINTAINPKPLTGSCTARSYTTKLAPSHPNELDQCFGTDHEEVSGLVREQIQPTAELRR